MFCATGLVFDGTVGVGSRFLVVRSRTRFRRYRGRRVPFSYFALPNSFSAVTRASAPDFTSLARGVISYDTEGVGNRFHVLHSWTRFFDGIEGDGYSFQRYRGRRVMFPCFALPDSFSAVSGVMCPVFMFCAPGIVSRSTEGVGSRFHVLRSRTRFGLS
jgi:hypothetical protein